MSKTLSARRSLAGGAWPAEPGRRSLAGGAWPAEPGRRSLAGGAWPAEPGRRSLAGGAWPSIVVVPPGGGGLVYIGRCHPNRPWAVACAAALLPHPSLIRERPRGGAPPWGKRQRTRTGRGPDACRAIEFINGCGPDVDRTRAAPFLPPYWRAVRFVGA
eukprot:gene25309-biopygen17998